MKSIRRFALLLSLPLLLSSPATARAASFDDSLPTAQALAQLELRAQQANPRDQCFLYTELVHVMTEMAGKQMLNGDVDQATATLKKVNAYAMLIHMDIASNSKRLKNAEELMHHTSYRLGEYLHKASNEDRDTLQATLKQLDQVHDELLAQVFKH
ncbi:hypothetical protein [Tunturibacter empetritectus]|uniref:Uncharacterized protein n=1 Tax=Tunturiibacter empetritectus TaxID=3069691 RepID=A0A7W8IEW7_9BACT|nr:hypothetical protein [Edaphobacter lichenicola]MBB5315901.1 hypothetical protein [Edaphobacter lichenicola]